MNYYCIILMYTFVDNKELDAEFLQQVKEKFPDCVQINESAYAINRLECSIVANEIKHIYEESTKEYPSKGKDYVGILYAATLTDEKSKSKFDKIVEQSII